MYIHVPVAASFHPPSKEEMAGGRERTTTILLASRLVRTNNRPVTCRLLARVRLLHILAQLWAEHCCRAVIHVSTALASHAAFMLMCISHQSSVGTPFRRHENNHGYIPSHTETMMIPQSYTTIVCSALIVFHFWARWSIYRSIFVTSGSSQVMEHVHPLCGLITW